MSLLQVIGLSVTYRGKSGPVAVLDGIELAVQKGEVLGVVGESGSGKTVLVRAVLGVLSKPLELAGGSVLFRGRELVGIPERDLLKIRGRDIGMTTADPRKHLNPLLTVGAQMVNVVRAHSHASRAAANARALELLESVGIPDPFARLAAYPHELSGGMCQRVIIAMSLAHSPELLLADEPTAGLDVTISRQILDLMSRLVRERNSAMMLVSRDLGVVAHYCQRVAVIEAGQIVEQADVATFFANPQHPYSRRLLNAAAASRGNERRRNTAVGGRAD